MVERVYAIIGETTWEGDYKLLLDPIYGAYLFNLLQLDKNQYIWFESLVDVIIRLNNKYLDDNRFVWKRWVGFNQLLNAIISICPDVAINTETWRGNLSGYYIEKYNLPDQLIDSILGEVRLNRHF